MYNIKLSRDKNYFVSSKYNQLSEGMDIVVMSPNKYYRGETEIVTQLFDEGLNTFHLRKHSYSRRRLKHYLNRIPKHYLSRIIIHSHYTLALKFNLKGIHFTRKSRKKPFQTWLLTKYIKFRNSKLKYTASFHSISSLYEENNNFDYVFISPVFDSISKSGYQSGFSLYTLKTTLNRTKHKVYAVGGVAIDKLDQIKDVGFEGITLVGSIWKSSTPVESYKSIITKWKKIERMS